MTREFAEGCIRMMMDTCGIREYTIDDGADKPLRYRFVATSRVDIESVKEKMIALKDAVEFVTDWRL
jgi:hypothetical protein